MWRGGGKSVCGEWVADVGVPYPAICCMPCDVTSWLVSSGYDMERELASNPYGYEMGPESTGWSEGSGIESETEWCECGWG